MQCFYWPGWSFEDIRRRSDPSGWAQALGVVSLGEWMMDERLQPPRATLASAVV